MFVRVDYIGRSSGITPASTCLDKKHLPTIKSESKQEQGYVVPHEEASHAAHDLKRQKDVAQSLLGHWACDEENEINKIEVRFDWLEFARLRIEPMK
jgi:hypothetical protein